jgi:hypothetical protein
MNRKDIILLCMLIGVAAYSFVHADSGGAPFIFKDPSHVGASQGMVDQYGYYMGQGLRGISPTSYVSVQSSDRTTVAGFAPNGAMLVAGTDCRGSLTLAGTGEVTKTFSTAEPDTNYYIVGTLVTNGNVSPSPTYLKRRNVGSFVIGDNSNLSGFTYEWVKIRTATP